MQAFVAQIAGWKSETGYREDHNNALYLGLALAFRLFWPHLSPAVGHAPVALDEILEKTWPRKKCSNSPVS